MKQIHPEMLKALRSYYPPGTRVELVRMEDPYTMLKPGDQGTVSLIDDTGTVFVNWDSGSGLGVVFGEDEIRKLDDTLRRQVGRNGGDQMNETIRRQILAIRESGVTNMFDIPRVTQEAYSRDFHELVNYLNDHKTEYARFILTGEEDESK